MREGRERREGRRGREKANEKTREERRRQKEEREKTREERRRQNQLITTDAQPWCTTVYLLMSTELLSTVPLPVLP